MHFLRISILLLATSITGCTKFDALNATVPSCGYSLISDIPYEDGPRHQLDVYVPNHAKPGTSVVVFFYGGDWQTGTKGDYHFVGEALASKGFIAVLPDYRIYPQVVFPHFIEDGAAAVAWVHSHIAQYKGNPAHVYLMGHSAGAHIAAMLNLDPRYLMEVGLSRSAIRGTIGLSGPYDFVPSLDDRPVFAMSHADTQPSADIEPIHFVDGSAPPMLLIQGLNDQTVAPDNTQNLAMAIFRAGGRVETRYYPGVGHVRVVLSFATLFRWLTPALNDVTAYIHEQDKIHR